MQITKLKRKPFYSSHNNASKPMELVHSVVSGKLETSYNDFNYYVTFLMISLEKFGSTLSRINLMFLTYLLNFINLFPILLYIKL